MPHGSYSLGETAAERKVVRLVRDKCGRRGQYRIDRLLELCGPNIATPALRHELAQCPHRPTGKALPKEIADQIMERTDGALKGTIVTVDALNCQREISQQIIEQGGDYALALKGNHGTLYADVSTFLDDPKAEATTTNTTVDADHGRIEIRTAVVSTHVDWLQEQHQWPGLQAIAKVTRIRETTDKTSSETAYYLLSQPLAAERFNSVARAHWSVENSLHWRLDVVMEEDWARNRMDNGPQNLAVLRHIWLSTSCARIPGRLPSVGNSRLRPGTTIISSTSSPNSEMRLPCRGRQFCALQRRDVVEGTIPDRVAAACHGRDVGACDVRRRQSRVSQCICRPVLPADDRTALWAGCSRRLLVTRGRYGGSLFRDQSGLAAACVLRTARREDYLRCGCPIRRWSQDPRS
jgi:predicted transposase YbfD/YdcC